RPILTLDPNLTVRNFWSGTNSLPPGASSEVFILASGAQPGLLHPGEKFQVPVYFTGLLQGWSATGLALEIRYWTADNPDPIDWTAAKSELRPPTLDSNVWDIIFANLTGDLPTTGDYVSMLNDNATFLGRLGQRVIDVSELWNFELQQAYGYSPLPVIDSVTDAAVASPGASLSIDRRFSSNLRSRWESGPFGRGWFTSWQTRLDSENNGAVVRIIGEGGSARVFVRDTRNGGYFSGAGDSTKLSALGGGAYELREPDGSVTRFNSLGRIGVFDDANGNRVSATYSSNRLETLTHSSGATITLGYNGSGKINQVTESTGRTVTYTYQGDYLESATTGDGKTTTYTYQTTGIPARLHALTSVTRAGVTRSFAWDDRGRLSSSAVAGNQQTMAFGYDSAGGVAVSDAFGSTSFLFDHHGLLAKTVDPLGNITSSEYDKDLRLKRLVLPSGDTRSFTWCSCGSPATITDELGHTTRFRYDHPLKKMTSFIDAKGNRTNYSYDAKGNLLATTYADQSVESLAGYDAAGLPASLTNRRGQTSTFTYTPQGQIARRTLAEGDIADFEYDARGNLIRVTEQPPSGPQKVTTYDYTPATDGDRLRKVSYPNGGWVEYFYDANGRRSRMVDSAGGDTRYEYDDAGRLWKLHDSADAAIVEYLYDEVGRLRRINKGNGTYTTYQHDAAGQILLLINHAPDGSEDSSFGYTYDERGRRIRMETLDGTWTYFYDATSQLVRASFASSSPYV
ncbi:MAG: RHS repeat protein, partial [Verrucomicrobiae bacterium]|nr:RHS repeat protein [Verrucomicrobiae bacterium]